MWAYPEIRTLGQYPEYWARHDPERPALRTLTRTMSFAEFDRKANQVGNYLLKRISASGTLIGFLGRNSIDFYLALFGTAKTRSGLVIYNWRLAAGELASPTRPTPFRLGISTWRIPRSSSTHRARRGDQRA